MLRHKIVFQQKLSTTPRFRSLGRVLSALHNYNPFGDARAPWNGAYQRMMDYSWAGALCLYNGMTAAVGHFSLSSSDTTAL